MYLIRQSTRFRRDLKRCQKRGARMEKFKTVHESLVRGQALPERNRDHPLNGEWKGNRECHIEPDWLLIYRIDEKRKILEYIRMGSHADLFGM